MAIDSVGGGSWGGDELSEDAIQILDNYLSDLVTETDGSVKPTVTQLANGSTIITGVGEGGVLQGALIGSDVAVAAEISDGVMELAINLPANLNLVFESIGDGDLQTSAEVKASLDAKLEEALPDSNTDPAAAALRASILNAIDNITAALTDKGEETSIVRLVDFTDLVGSSSGDSTIKLDGSGSSGGSEVFALLMTHISEGNLELSGIENAILIGSGEIIVTDSTNTNLQGDTFNQMITGGSGNDTLVGGGGNDTLVGGAGDDIIGFNALGHYTVDIVDISGPGNDALAFDFAGINTIDDLVPFVTDITESDGNVIVDFGTDASITLVGMTTDEITDGLLKFDL